MHETSRIRQNRLYKATSWICRGVGASACWVTVRSTEYLRPAIDQGALGLLQTEVERRQQHARTEQASVDSLPDVHLDLPAQSAE